MLTSILDEGTSLNEPFNSKRKSNFDNNFNNKNRNKERKQISNDEFMNQKNNYYRKENYKSNNQDRNNMHNIYDSNDNDNGNDNPYIINNHMNKSPYESNKRDFLPSSNWPINSFNSKTNNINVEKDTNYNNNYNIYDNNNIQSQIYNKQLEDNNNNKNIIPIDNSNNNYSKPLYEIQDYNNDNILMNEYYIKYVALNRQGYEHIHDRNYLSGLLIFQKCYELSQIYLKDKIKEMNSLINISICEYYNGNFSESYSVINKAKIIYDSIILNKNIISSKQKLQLTLKLFINSSLANLDINNYNESKSDILFLISTIRKEPNIDKQFIYFRTIIFALFKIESLINYDISENDTLKNIGSYNEVEINEPIRIINHLMKGFIHFLKEKNFSILLNTFKDAAQKYKRLNDFNGYYFSLFYHYLVLYNLKKNNSELNDLEDIKKKISICNNKLIGNELINQIKEKDINKLLREFVDKINCACEIFQLLEKFENELNNRLNEFNKEKYNMNLSEDENNLSFSHLLDKSHIFTNEKINSPIFIQLLLRYSINFLENQKMNSLQNSNINNDKENGNIDTLLNELKMMMKKINSKEINIENIKLHQLDKEMINSLKQLFDNLIYIYYKSKLYKYFKVLRNNIQKFKHSEIDNYILEFLNSNSEKLLNGLHLTKINYKTKGSKKHFYDVDEDNMTFNIRKSDNDNYLSKSYSLFNDIKKVSYGIKSRNLRKKLLSKEKDNDSITLLRMPWKFISLITNSRSIDLYCEDNQLNYVFYGLKNFFINNVVPYKINSTSYFVLNKIKLKIAVKLKKKYQEEEEEELPNIVKQLIKEKAIQNISFTKLFLLFNKYK